jgi:hypothetical protein
VAHARREQDASPERQRRRSWGGRHASCGWSEGGSQLLTRLLAAAPRRVATSPVPATDPEHSEPGGAGVRGRGALSGGSTRGGRGAGAEPSAVQEAGGSNPSGSYQREKLFPFSCCPPLDRTPAAGTRPCGATPAESSSDPWARSQRSPRRPPRRSNSAPAACSRRRRGRESA